MVAKRKASRSRFNPKKRMDTTEKDNVSSLNHDRAAAGEVANSSDDACRVDIGKMKKLPVTVLSGFLGSGKTTALKHILNSPDHKLRIAVIVNDMAEVNIDGAQVSRINASKSNKEEIVQMQNGCICCTLRGDFIVELARLARSDKFDYLVIESSGISEPMQVAESFAFELNTAYLEIGDGITDESKKIIEEVTDQGGLNAVAYIDTMVTVVDAHNFFCEFETGAFLKDRFAKEDVPDEDERTISNLFADQLEFANVIIINKADLVDAEILKRVKGIVRTFNPAAELLEATQSKVDVRKIVSTGKFDHEEAKLSPGWLKSLQEMIEVDVNGTKRMAPVPETLEYGIGSFVYRARKPFDPEKLFNFFKSKFHLFQPKEQDEEDVEENIEEDDAESMHSEEDTDDDMSSSASDDEDVSRASTPASAPPSSTGSIKEADKEESLSAIVENKRSDPLLAGIYRIKGFIWLATRPRMTGEVSAAGAILTVAGFQEWHAEKLFGSCAPCTEIRDPEPIKELMHEMLRRQDPEPWLQISEKLGGCRDKVARCLHACYYSAADIDVWFSIVDDPELSDADKEERLEDMLLDKFDDLNLEYIYLVCRDMAANWGDRRQEVVFIGEKLDSKGLTAALDACLLTDDEMTQWEKIMGDNELDKKAARMLKKAQDRLQSEDAKQWSKKKLDRMEDRVAEARFYIAQAKEDKLLQLWKDEHWAEWFAASDGHDHDHDHDHDDGHN